MASGDQDRIVAVVAASSESDKDLSKTLTSIMLGIATTMGFHHGRSLYSLCESRRMRKLASLQQTAALRSRLREP